MSLKVHFDIPKAFTFEVYVHVQHMYNITDVVHVMVSDMWCIHGNVTCTQNCIRTALVTLQLKMLVCINVL